MNDSLRTLPFEHPLLDAIQNHSKCDFLHASSSSSSYKDLLDAILSVTKAVSGIQDEKVGIYYDDLSKFLKTLIACELVGKSAVILSPQLSESDVEKLSKLIDFKVMLSDKKISFKGKVLPDADLEGDLHVPQSYSPGEIIMTTSGSTGVPKGVLHSWESLLKKVSIVSRGEDASWLLTYDFATFAGLQVILHALMNGASLVQAEDDFLKSSNLERITHISATPSFWRKAMLQIEGSKDLPSLKHVTIGGEAVTQELLDALDKKFQGIEITQIYASTEMGACFYVKDKKVGLPKSVLDGKDIQVKIKDGELYIRSSAAMQKYWGGNEPFKREEWFPTGDLVTEEGDRILFLGRKQNIINVGGAKVFPQEVEEAIYQVPEVLHVRVQGQESSVLGQIVQADIQLADDQCIDLDHLKEKILSHCHKVLARAKVPRVIHFTRESLMRGSKINRRSK